MKRLLGVAIALSLLMAACGSDDETSTTTDDSAAPAATTAPDTATDDAAAEPTEAPSEETPAEEPTAAPDSTDDAASDTADETDAETAASVDLSGVCPDPLVLQTDWYPSPEHGYAYSLIGAAGELDKENGVYRGPLLDTGIDLEIRAGGPYLGYQPTTSQMFVDTGIHLGYVSTDEAVAAAANDLSTVAVVAPLEINPQILMWNPEKFQFTSFEEIGQSDVTVTYFAGATYIDYMIGAGILQQDQVDPSYDGTPARFVAEDGAIVQQGFATSEPYFYEYELAEWMKPVDYLLVHDSGFQIYSQPIVVRSEALDELRPCLELVVPIIQQAVVDHYADSTATDQVILDIVDELESSWVLYPGQMAYSTATALELGVASNGPDDIVGNFDDARMERSMEQLRSTLADIPDDLTIDQLYTNEFIDPTIGFAS